VDDIRIPRPARTPKDPATRLQRLEEKHRRELMGEDERLEVYEAIVRLRRRLGRPSHRP
jgi:hypothetical protein